MSGEASYHMPHLETYMHSCHACHTFYVGRYDSGPNYPQLEQKHDDAQDVQLIICMCRSDLHQTFAWETVRLDNTQDRGLICANALFRYKL